MSVVLLYDGACRFCIRSLRALKRFDSQNRLELVDATDRAGVDQRFPQTRGADFDAAMYAIEGSRVYRGFDAFRHAMWRLPSLSWLAMLMYLPGIPPLGRRAYDIIARNRHALGCSSEACDV
jgi:predicted DCC family thiol-disulfide oxidoreductase YuxK